MKRGLTGFDSNSSLISASRDVMKTQNKANFALLQSVSDNKESVFGISCKTAKGSQTRVKMLKGYKSTRNHDKKFRGKNKKRILKWFKRLVKQTIWDLISHSRASSCVSSMSTLRTRCYLLLDR